MERARIERRTTIARGRVSAWSRVVDDFGQWFGPDATLDARLGGRVTSGDRVGHVTLLEPQRSIRWEWSLDGDPGWTEVRIDLEPNGETTDIVVTETLHDWEHEQYDAIDGGGPIGPFGVLASVEA